MRVSIYGAGAYGITLAKCLADNNHEVLLYTNSNDTLNKINEDHIHPLFNVKINDSIKATIDVKEALDFSDIFLIALPSSVIRGFLLENLKYFNKEYLFINSSKGIEENTTKTISQIISDVIPSKYIKSYVCLSGPGHAEELILDKFTSLVAASSDKDSMLLVQKMFSNNYLRVYSSYDVLGVEAGGACKNAIAIISGAATGVGLGENARSALITRGMNEISLIVKSLGGKEKTAYGLSGLGDLVVTCFSENSRNYRFGLKIGKGMSVKDALLDINQVVEGVKTVYACYNIGKLYNLYLPLIDTTYNFLEGNLSLKEAFKQLIERELKMEYSEEEHE